MRATEITLNLEEAADDEKREGNVVCNNPSIFWYVDGTGMIVRAKNIKGFNGQLGSSWANNARKETYNRGKET